MNEFLKVYRSTLNALALILMLLIPFLQYAAASGHSTLLIPTLVLFAVVLLYILRNG
jgi:hypothetical protein